MTTNIPDEWKNLEYRARTLFSPSSPISEADLFNGRAQQIDRLINTVAERGRHAVLFGERGVGKTSLGNTFHKLIGSTNGFIHIRQQASPLDTYSTLWRKVFRDLRFEVKTSLGYGNEEKSTKSIADFYPDAITPDDVVREMRKFTSAHMPVIIFDEFDHIKDQSTKGLMAHTIKALSDSGANVTILLIGVADDVTALVAEHQSVSRNIEEIKMPRMHKDELNDILNQRYKTLGMKIEGDARWQIVTLSRGLPEYVHSLGRDSAIQALREKKLLIKEEHVAQAIQDMLNQSDQSIRNVYKKAIYSNRQDALYREVLIACSIAESDDEGRFTASALIQPLSKILSRKISIANFQNHLAAFAGAERGNILEKHGSKRAFKYRFFEPKMQPYVIMQGIDAGIIGRDALSVLSTPEQPLLPIGDPVEGEN